MMYMSKASKQPTMEDLLNHVGEENNLVVGEKIEAVIISIAKNEAVLDIVNVGLGVVRGRELYNEEYLAQLELGQTVEAIILSLENEKGMVEMSFKAIGRDKI